MAGSEALAGLGRSWAGEGGTFVFRFWKASFFRLRGCNWSFCLQSQAPSVVPSHRRSPTCQPTPHNGSRCVPAGPRALL
jgi:hypothetical protein